MSVKQSSDKLDKRAKALRDNLRKRQPVKKPAKKADNVDDENKGED